MLSLLELIKSLASRLLSFEQLFWSLTCIEYVCNVYHALCLSINYFEVFFNDDECVFPLKRRQKPS